MINSGYLAIKEVNWDQKGKEHLSTQNYIAATKLYEQAISVEPHVKSHYWNLGLILLLQGKETEAQTCWFLAMAEGEDEEIELWTLELIEILKIEAERRYSTEDYSVAWVIRQHIREIIPTDMNNLLYLIELNICLKTYTGNEIVEWGVINLLQDTETPVELDYELLDKVQQKILEYAPLYTSSLEFTEARILYIKSPSSFIDDFMLPIIYKIAYEYRKQQVSLKYVDLGLRIFPNHPELLRCLATFYTDLGEFSKAIEAAKLCYSLPGRRLMDKIYDNHMILRSIMNAGTCGYVDEVAHHINIQEQLLESLYQEYPTNLGSDSNVVGLYNTTFFFNYIRDDPQVNMKYRSQLAQVCQVNIETDAKNVVDSHRQKYFLRHKSRVSSRPLKIGYLSYCLRRHSVGWLARSLFQYHDQEKFELYTYMLGCTEAVDPLQQWYINQSHKSHQVGLAGMEVAKNISDDEIDILIDLDSITLSSACGILSIKSAPIQATWLGWDASAMPTIDYYIADPYVLPENAQDYYPEKIWRLPQTYIAVDGFEVGIPTLSRQILDIPSDAVVYFGVQRGVKYHPRIARLQVEILKNVPNSYFLMKGYGERDAIDDFFRQAFESEGISHDRLKFIPNVNAEEIHRANLAIADIVLDTYPYNGATTTMETLWMEIPIVTLVGQQFSARNSYTMMMNAGITEGIAWTDEEYVEWGIRLGREPMLRQKISWKLRQAKRTAPLWNGQQFTREMEKAYQQMWEIYINS